MKTLGQGSLASLLKILLDIVYYLLWAVLGLASLIIVVIVFGGLYRLLGFGSDLPASIRQFLAMDVVLALPLAIMALAAVTFVVDRLRRIMATLIAGDPFVEENSNHLRSIAIGIAVYQLLHYGAHGVLSLMITLLGRPIEGGARVVPEFSLNLGAWFAVLAMLVLAEIFREGTRMREEQKLTI
ncbi:hypothetical protein OA2633_10469 [Oceanicaulis sp. HTCC2633]|jgi:hypothetical protein|uniref:DUF2975 domain-containing protein n=1 Tax=Oceanicaulis sp. HTCC2633 TaxID=314254 RepID=UPI000066986C|nr:DUF2975 domain-containing protein [Oceanicaulis sp. HTCC2633]EAP89684.1 hypothetical protein OA2633_10469 [Oceanicaulis sp. HTCC2633]